MHAPPHLAPSNNRHEFAFSSNARIRIIGDYSPSLVRRRMMEELSRPNGKRVILLADEDFAADAVTTLFRSNPEVLTVPFPATGTSDEISAGFASCFREAPDEMFLQVPFGSSSVHPGWSHFCRNMELAWRTMHPLTCGIVAPDVTSMARCVASIFSEWNREMTAVEQPDLIGDYCGLDVTHHLHETLLISFNQVS